MLYLLDSNVLITANAEYYAVDRIPQFWEWILAEATSDKVKLPREIFAEITPADERFKIWLKEHRKRLEINESYPRSLVNTVLESGYGFPHAQFSGPEALAQSNDALLIAYGLADKTNRCLVTLEEVQNPDSTLPKVENRKIPLVCHRLGVKCINTFDLIRELDFRIPLAAAPA